MPESKLYWALAAAALLCGCQITVEPPGSPEEPVMVYILDHGRHSSLVLPQDQGGGLVRYSYGDWQWYALGREGLYRGAAALFWPTQAALGRRELAAAATPQDLRRVVAVGMEAVHPVQVASRRAAELHKTLHALFERRQAEAVWNTDYDLEFAPHPAPYSLFRNSNSVVAGWLRELGCEVSPLAFWADWHVRP